mgnify:CR=1 FL=1
MAVPYEEFVKVVSEMRNKQTEYFRTRDKKAHAESKALEKRVDAIIGEIERPNLFG